MNILTMPDESTCDGQRKYLHWSSQVLAFFEAVSKKHTKKSKPKKEEVFLYRKTSSIFHIL